MMLQTSYNRITAVEKSNSRNHMFYSHKRYRCKPHKATMHVLNEKLLNVQGKTGPTYIIYKCHNGQLWDIYKQLSIVSEFYVARFMSHVAVTIERQAG